MRSGAADEKGVGDHFHFCDPGIPCMHRERSANKPFSARALRSVAISASVKRDNAPVANLTAADFRLTDNGVPQSIDAVTIESVPLDVTLFMDTSGSTAGALDRMKSKRDHDRENVAAG